MPANMRIDQAGLSAGIPGRARTDGLADGSIVTVTNLGGGTSLVRLLWVPPEDTTAVSTLTESAPNVWTFIPSMDVYGSYRIELIVDQGLSTESRQIRIFGVRTPEGLLIPAANESADSSASLVNDTVSTVDRSENNEAFGPFVSGSSFGWWRALRDTIMAVSGGGGGGLTLSQVIAQLGGRGASAYLSTSWGDPPVSLQVTTSNVQVDVSGSYDPEMDPPRVTVDQPPIGQSRNVIMTLGISDPANMYLLLDFLGTNVFVHNSEDNTFAVREAGVYMISGTSFDIGGGSVGTLWRVISIEAKSIEEIAGLLAGLTTAQLLGPFYGGIFQVQDNAGSVWIQGIGYVDGGTPPIVHVPRPGEPGGREIIMYVDFPSNVPYTMQLIFDDATVHGTDGADSFLVLDPGLYRLSALTNGGLTEWRVSNVLTGNDFGGRNETRSYELFHGGSPEALNQSVGLATVEVSGDDESPPPVILLPQPQSGRMVVLDLDLDAGCLLELQALGDAEFFETGTATFILDREGPYLLYSMQGNSVAASWRIQPLSSLPLEESVSRGEAGFEPDTGSPSFASATKTMDIRSSNKTIALMPNVGAPLGRKHTLVVYCGPHELTLDPGDEFALRIANRPEGAVGASAVLPTPIDGVAVFEIRGVLNALGTQPVWVVVPLATYDDVRIGDPLGGAWPTYGRVYGPFEGGGCTDYLDNNIRSASPLPAITSDGGQVGNGGSEIGRPGIATLATGSSSNAVAILGGHPEAIVPGHGEIRWRADENLPAAADGTDSFVHRAGLFNNHFSAGFPTHGAYFDYDYTVGPNYLFITSAGGAPQVTDTGVAAVGPVFNALEIILNADGTQARAAINGIVVATHTTVPTAAIGPGVNLLKTAGTGYRSLAVDLQGCRSMQAVAR